MKSCIVNRRRTVFSLALPGGLFAASLFVAGSVLAGGGGRVYGPAPWGCESGACEPVVRTVYVPTMVKERRLVTVTECHVEQRQRQVMVRRCVPETSAVREVYTVMVPEVRQRAEQFTVCRPVWREVERDITVQIPVEERRQGVRHVCRQVKVQEMRSVTRDHGQWEEVMCQADCHAPGCATSCGRPVRRWGRGGDVCNCQWSGGYDGGCGKPITAHAHRVWKPNLVTEQVPVTVWRNEMVEEPFEYVATVWRPEVRRQTVKVCETVKEQQVRDVQYTVCVPQQRERVRNVTRYRTVLEPRVETYKVLVPHTVQKEVEVTVCRMTPQQIICP